MVKGKVNFYGLKTKEKYNTKTKSWTPTDEKELVLTIKDPKFTQSALDKIVKFYETADRLPNWYEPLINEGVAPVYMTFKTRPEYAPDQVQIIKDGQRVTVDISEVDMNDALITMVYNGCYLGKILVNENGRPFDPFADVNFEELPFK